MHPLSLASPFRSCINSGLAWTTKFCIWPIKALNWQWVFPLYFLCHHQNTALIKDTHKKAGTTKGTRTQWVLLISTTHVRRLKRGSCTIWCDPSLFIALPLHQFKPYVQQNCTLVKKQNMFAIASLYKCFSSDIMWGVSYIAISWCLYSFALHKYCALTIVLCTECKW